MYVLILIMFMTFNTPDAITSAEFSSQEIQRADNVWKMPARFNSANLKLFTVRMPK